MPIHDWTRVDAGIFHDFHHEWISTIRNALNRGILPPDHYALAEQIAGGFGPDVVTLEGPMQTTPGGFQNTHKGVALAEAAPKVSFRAKTEADIYAAKANRIAIRHVSNHRVVAMIEIVSPGNKGVRSSLRSFAEKAADLLRRGIHLMVIDLLPAGPRDPQGIHQVIWDELTDNDFALPENRKLTVASYIGGLTQEAFVEPLAVAGALPEMPLFLTPDVYVLVPLEATYLSAWEAVPDVWKNALSAAAGSENP
jgi:hypothetical protein